MNILTFNESVNQMLREKIAEFQIPVVDSHDPVTNPVEFLASIKAIEGSEGVVVVWPDGHRCKSKSMWYLVRHKARDNLLHEKNVIDVIINEKSDDVKPLLSENDRKALESFESKFWHGVNVTAWNWRDQGISAQAKSGGDRKVFALGLAQQMDGHQRAAIFKAWGDPDFDWRQSVIDVVAKNLGTQPRVDSVRELFGNAKWNYGVVTEDQ